MDKVGVSWPMSFVAVAFAAIVSATLPPFLLGTASDTVAFASLDIHDEDVRRIVEGQRAQGCIRVAGESAGCFRASGNAVLFRSDENLQPGQAREEHIDWVINTDHPLTSRALDLDQAITVSSISTNDGILYAFLSNSDIARRSSDGAWTPSLSALRPVQLPAGALAALTGTAMLALIALRAFLHDRIGLILGAPPIAVIFAALFAAGSTAPLWWWHVSSNVSFTTAGGLCLLIAAVGVAVMPKAHDAARRRTSDRMQRP